MATRKPPVSYRIFREHYDRLVHAIQDPLPLATRLLSLRIITPAVKEDISAVGLPTPNKNRVLLSAVEKQIQLDPQTFHVFISALKEDPSMQLLVDSMQSGVGERVDPTGDSEKSKSGSPEERESCSTEGLEEYETEYEAISEEETLQIILQNCIAHKDVDCFHCHLDELARLLQNNELKKLLEESLCYAAYVGSNPIVETLIQNGVDINAMSRVPEHPTYSHVVMSPLHWAAVEGHTNTVKCLVDEGANLNCLDNAVYTPLHWAARNGHVDTVKYLVDRGANIYSKDFLERIPQDLAKCEEVVACLKQAADQNMLEESESTGREHELRQYPDNTASRSGTKMTDHED